MITTVSTLKLIGMPEAALRMGLSTRGSALRALRRAGVPLIDVHGNAVLVEEAELAKHIAQVGEHRQKGRPRKSSQTEK